MKFQLRIYKLVLRPVLEESLYLWNALEYVHIQLSCQNQHTDTTEYLHVLVFTCCCKRGEILSYLI